MSRPATGLATVDVVGRTVVLQVTDLRGERARSVTVYLSKADARKLAASLVVYAGRVGK